ncbi:TPA: helix-turn-helix transcriptional regulator [Morganella morganii subsp. morganii]|nr:helix-turn-helix transcriptional regulator [Morganella morganii subsp. morganii]
MARKNRQRKKVKVHICTPEQYAGTVISARRKELGLSGKQLGQQIGVSQQQISRYESGKSNITLSQLVLLSVALGMSLRQFMDEFFLLSETAEEDFSDQKKVLPYLSYPPDVLEDTIAAEVLESDLLFKLSR